MEQDNVDWVILILLKSHQDSFPIYLQTLINLFVENLITYFLIQKGMYFLLGIFSCGDNQSGQCGLGHFNDPQITPSLIPNLPSNIVQFVCGCHHCLYLDSEGNVYSIGRNYHGQLGLGHNTNQNVLNKIVNISSIKIISCSSESCYLVDFEGNLWSFGDNTYEQLGHGNRTNINAPKIVITLTDIQQISHGCCVGFIFWPKTLKIKYLP